MKLTCYTFELAERHKPARDYQTARQILQRSTRSIRLIELIFGPGTNSIYRFTFRLPIFGPTWTHQPCRFPGSLGFVKPTKLVCSSINALLHKSTTLYWLAFSVFRYKQRRRQRNLGLSVNNRLPCNPFYGAGRLLLWKPSPFTQESTY